ncbi:MAG: GntR family transcriptional regulator/MocR family aminotransferase [Paracoccaceae bacterium]|jgi:GntR family transcriptional regulator/MocR family aminotransferase
MSDTQASARAQASDINARALSGYYAGPAMRQGLVLGYAGFDDAQLETAAHKLGAALRA